MYQATVKGGVTNMVVAGRGPFQAGDTVVLTDAEYASLNPGVFASIFTGAPVQSGGLSLAGESDYPGTSGEFNQVGVGTKAARSDHSHSGLPPA